MTPEEQLNNLSVNLARLVERVEGIAKESSLFQFNELKRDAELDNSLKREINFTFDLTKNLNKAIDDLRKEIYYLRKEYEAKFDNKMIEPKPKSFLERFKR